MKHYFLLEVESSARPGRQVERLEQTIARECHRHFGKNARAWRMNEAFVQRTVLTDVIDGQRPIEYRGDSI